jgi:hypothetical protein
MNFINDIQTSLIVLLVEHVVRKGGDVMNVNAMGLIFVNVHP